MILRSIATIALTIASASPASAQSSPPINPEICSHIVRVRGGYVVTQDTWILPAWHAKSGHFIKRNAVAVVGKELVGLIEATCSTVGA